MWQYSALMTRFFLVDGRASFAILILIYTPSMTSLILAVMFFGFLGALEYTGYDISNSFRKLRLLISGKHKAAKPYDVR